MPRLLLNEPECAPFGARCLAGESPGRFLALAFCAGVIPLAAAQPVRLGDRVEVTGTHIKRIDSETPSPLEVITAEEIARSGQPTVAEFLRRHPANARALDETFVNSFSPGGAGISLRGLGQKATLVLLNGRRVASYAFAQNLSDAYVDLNSLPSGAVDRIEILKDGASAVYGSDAIAGVVNIVLRRSFAGAEAGVAAGRFEGKGDLRADLAAGRGELATDGFNVLGVLSYYQRDHLTLAETRFNRTRDMRGHVGGRNAQDLTAGGTWQNLSTNARRAMAECRGRVLTPAEAIEAGLLTPSSPLNAGGNSFCTRDINEEVTALPRTRRLSMFGRGTKSLSAAASVFAEVGVSRVESSQAITSVSLATTGFTRTPQGLRPFRFNVNFAPGSSGNPFSSNARFLGQLDGIGARKHEITSDSGRVLVGLDYVLGRWDVQSAAGISASHVEQWSTNRLSVPGVTSAFAIPWAVQPPVPLSRNGTYNLDRPSVNAPEADDALRFDYARPSKSRARFVDTRASADLARLPGGPLALALGFEHRRESLRDILDPEIAAGNVLGSGTTQTDGARSVNAIFAELAIPFMRGLEGQLAARHDRYSDFGSATTPKAGVRWRVSDPLLLRASWGRGFRAPSLPEVSSSESSFIGGAFDPVTNANVEVRGLLIGSPELGPERFASTTGGIVIEPTPGSSLSIGYYRIDWRDRVASGNVQAIVNANDPRFVVRDPETGTIFAVITNYVNVERTTTRGFDLDISASAQAFGARWRARGAATYLESFREAGAERAGTSALPRVRAALALDWDRGPLSLTVTQRYVSGYRPLNLSEGFFVPQDPRLQNGTYPRKTRHHRTWDLFARCRVGPGLSIFAGVINVENEGPVFDPAWVPTSYDFTLFDPRGRQVRLGLSWKG